MIDQAVILCGGRGARLVHYTKNNPKPMLIIKNKPFLYHLLIQLKNQGINNFLILTGYKSNKIKNYFGRGTNLGINIQYSWAPNNWETSKRLLKIKNKLKDKFLICYSDNFIDFNLKKHFKKFKNKSLTLTLFKKNYGNIKILKNKYQYNNERKNKLFKFVELGYILARKSLIRSINPNYNKPISFFFEKIFKKRVSSIVVDHYHSISTIKRLQLTRKFFLSQKILLLDRDGIINERVKKGRYVKKIKDFKFITKSIKLLKILSSQGFSFIIITNQAGVGRKIMSENDLKKIHIYMLKRLKKMGIKIIKIYYCKHHWKDNCFCRKPKPYMILKSIEDFNLNKRKIIYIGDDLRDWETAKNAKCKYMHKHNKILTKNKLYLGSINDQKTALKIINRNYS